jgi:hypothetical protein
MSVSTFSAEIGDSGFHRPVWNAARNTGESEIRVNQTIGATHIGSR